MNWRVILASAALYSKGLPHDALSAMAGNSDVNPRWNQCITNLKNSGKIHAFESLLETAQELLICPLCCALPLSVVSIALSKLLHQLKE